ncbi:MAG: cyclic nucleotide-binding domain-containing protein [Verrucomicrobia bacterium]|nr:cyclic nucleotide-binding domain-containing protein [Verrucomicrobiota bacterium]
MGEQPAQEVGYKIWAVDDVVYGPVDMPTLVEWVKDERVLADTWVFTCHKNKWNQAGQMGELRTVFNAVLPGSIPVSHTPLIAGIRPGSLRRVKILGEMNDQQLGRFAQFMEVENARQFHTIVKQGDPGDAMYLILEGELRVRQMIGGKETVLVTLMAGEFFGDISLFDHGPRSADVVANDHSVLLKVSTANLQRMTQEVPELATPFLVAICKTLTARIRADNRRLRDSINVARASR